MNELKFEYSPAQLRSVIEKIENDPFSNFLRAKLHRFFRWLLNRRNSFKIIGQDNLRSVKNFVLVSNHSSHLDVICLLSTLPLEKLNGCYSVAAEDYFFSNDIFAYLSRIFANTLPISRSFGAYAGLKACATLLDQGKSIIIFPEGTRSRSGEIQSFKPGIGMLMAGRKVPVLPAYIDGAFKALPKGHLFPTKASITISIGEPLFFDKYENNNDNWQSIAELLYNKVKGLAKRT